MFKLTTHSAKWEDEENWFNKLNFRWRAVLWLLADFLSLLIVAHFLISFLLPSSKSEKEFFIKKFLFFYRKVSQFMRRRWFCFDISLWIVDDLIWFSGAEKQEIARLEDDEDNCKFANDEWMVFWYFQVFLIFTFSVISYAKVMKENSFSSEVKLIFKTCEWNWDIFRTTTIWELFWIVQ